MQKEFSYKDDRQKICFVHPDKANLDEWLKMRCMLWNYHIKFTLRTEMKDIYKRFQKGERMIYLARLNEIYAGFIELSLRESVPGCTTSPVGFIEGWFVKEEYRGNGVGRCLTEQGELWAKSKGCTEMASDTRSSFFPLSPAAHNTIGYNTTLLENDHFYFIKKL